MRSRHLQGSILEDHARGVLDEAEVARVNAHLSECPACAARLAKTAREVRTIRAALLALGEEPLDFTHYTTDGPVHLHVERRRGKWLARVGGGTPELRSSFPTVHHANDFLRGIFGDLYPRHSCTPACHAGPPET